jgi:hypothetical protein
MQIGVDFYSVCGWIVELWKCRVVHIFATGLAGFGCYILALVLVLLRGKQAVDSLEFIVTL